jgi:hypothetical protein
MVRAHYYHPAMKGPWSLKAVLPRLAPDLDYGTLGAMQDGLAAQLAYLAIITPCTDPLQRAQWVHDLSAYCEQDTLALVRVAGYFMQPERAVWL